MTKEVIEQRIAFRIKFLNDFDYNVETDRTLNIYRGLLKNAEDESKDEKVQ